MTENHLGKVIDGRYRLDRLLGEGASGAVYAATQLSVDRMVAVKLLHGDETPGFANRFQAEARAIGKLNHTNIITLHDFGYDEDVDAHFMVTEYADGAPLSERMKEVMSTDLILKVALEVASALHHAHAEGILHRDLKPENVMLTRADGRVDVAKVLDFGLAEVFEPTNDDAASKNTVSAGNAAPSLLELSQELDPYADDGEEEEEEREDEPETIADDPEDAEPATAIIAQVDEEQEQSEDVKKAIDAQFADRSVDAEAEAAPGDEDE